MKISKKLENKYFIDSLKEERILNCEDGYRLITINVHNCTENEGIKLSELLIELYSKEISMYLYDYQFYCEDDKYFEFQICVDDEYLKEFNELYKEFKKPAKDLLAEENKDDEDFKIVKLNADITFGNGNLVYIDEYTLYNKELGYASLNSKIPYIPEGGRAALKAIIDEKIIDSIPYWIKSAQFKKSTKDLL